MFSAYAPVAASLRPSVRSTRPQPLLHVAGKRERQVSFSNHQAAIELAVEVNGGATTSACGDGCTVYGPDTATPVVTWIHNGGHVYPRGTSELIVDFFQDHRRE